MPRRAGRTVTPTSPPARSRSSAKQNPAGRPAAKASAIPAKAAAVDPEFAAFRPSQPVVGFSKIDEAPALQLVSQLMAIPGRSGDEAAVLQFVRDFALKLGVPARAITSDTAHRAAGFGESGNLIIKLPGTRRGPRRLLMAHVDTVPICVGAQPVRKGDWIRSANPATGLGGDDRSGVAVILTALAEVYRQQLAHPPLTLLFAVQEEIGLYGARHVALAKLGRPELCFNWDGGASHLLTIGATGDYGIEILIRGLASHAGVHPEQGVSAITIAAKAIARLAEGGWLGLVQKSEGTGSSNVGVIHGGEATNVVTPEVRLRAEVRSHDPRFRSRILDEFRDAFKWAASAVRSSAGLAGSIEFHAELKYESFRIAADAPVVQTAERVIRGLGLTPETRISNGGLDANWLSAHGLPTVTLGAGQSDIHTVAERLHVPTFLQACRIATAIAADWSPVES
jgi:tripeptide aminopeptidase